MSCNNDKTKDFWNDWSDEYYNEHCTQIVIEKIIKNPEVAFQRKTFEVIKKHFPDLKGKRICVPASGDNTAVFAFHLLGAKVTSVDISSQQLKNAQAIALKNKWDIEFVCEDSMIFNKVKTNEYDLVYTSNGAHVWISDLQLMYKNFNRVLKENGFYILFETHPFIRPFDDSKENITVAKPYENIGPFGEVPNYAWRIQDFINNSILAGFTIKNIEEFHSEVGSLSAHSWWYKSEEEAKRDNHQKHDWTKNPWAALPQWFVVCSQKI
jgi:SAM-dependent methyltransferase